MTQQRWRNWTEYALLMGAGAGTAATVATQQFFYASAPLTLLVAMGMLNRQRLEEQVAKVTEGQQHTSEHLADSLDVLQERVASMPTTEAFTSFQRSVMAHSDRAILRFSREIDKSYQEFEQRLAAIEAPDLSQLYQDMGGLQDQYTYLCTSVNNLTNHVQRLSTIPRMEAAETTISQLKTDLMQVRVTLENLGVDTRTNLSTLQDSVNHFSRRLRQMQPQSDPVLLKDEVRELIKTVSDLVPRREFAALSQRLQTLSEQQGLLQEAVQFLQANRQGQPAARILPPETDSEAEANRMTDFQQQIEHLQGDLVRLHHRLEEGQAPGSIQSAVQQSVADYVSSLQAQIDRLNQLNHTLAQQQQDIQRQLSALSEAGLDSAIAASQLNQDSVTPALLPERLPEGVAEQLESLRLRLDLNDFQINGLQEQLADSATAAHLITAPAGQWILDFHSDGLSSDTNARASASRRALEQAISQAEERLIMVWPWSETCELDESLVAHLHQMLARGATLEIGWCHAGDRSEGRLLAPISQRWKVEPTQKQRLKAALNRLLPLRQAFPDRFKFKILGTSENFLVCDRRFAILGMEPMITSNSVFPQLGLKLQTEDSAVVEQLLQRFDAPILADRDKTAYFNRGITRYDLGDLSGALLDLNHVIHLAPEDGVSHINKGVVYAQLGQIDAAIAAFDRAIHHSPDSFAAYCNRGYLHLEQGNVLAATDDFEQAIQYRPNSPIAYFYRGSARQKQNALQAAIADYSAAIERDQNNTALPYCYRSAAYQKQAAIDAAIADLEVATEYLSTQNDSKNLALLRRTLEKLYRSQASVA
ncbi:MAG: tetratricopeptide repeat protein [Cyanobacteria bacterium P01_H01_bin.119]